MLLVAKKCSKCKILLDASSFLKRTSAHDGHRSQCRECENSKAREYKSKNPKKMKELRKSYYESHRELEIETQRVFRENNRELIRERDRESYKNNPKKYIEKSTIWRLNNLTHVAERSAKWKKDNKILVSSYANARRARLRGAGGSYTEEDWIEILNSWGQKCASCRCSGPLAVDHIISINMGGNNSRDNLQPLCKSCNSSKGAKSYSFIKPRRNGE